MFEYSFATEGKGDAMRLSVASSSSFRDSLESSVASEVYGDGNCLVRSLSLETVITREEYIGRARIEDGIEI